ncbi:hypothetical protein DFH08DRAFT_903400 [Mycena albidolilacea]|uniref:Uncharacterized protein n=1 Tax=Mycena albidolilacea TaxID=1033008 RepID=A0AAD6Z2F9_9AGAR|nr:hypothetical protein DFH08DRAFT_903400 [Mycena albidolilacea]
MVIALSRSALPSSFIRWLFLISILSCMCAFAIIQSAARTYLIPVGQHLPRPAFGCHLEMSWLKTHRQVHIVCRLDVLCRCLLISGEPPLRPLGRFSIWTRSRCFGRFGCSDASDERIF